MKFFFCIFFILLFISKTENVYSNNLIYDVNNVEVKGKINKDSDKNKLIESAFKKAFIIFINKTLLKEDAVNLYKTKTVTIKDLVLTYQFVKKEKVGIKKNSFTLNIKFDPKKINKFFAQRSISYADISNISLTVLPVLIKEKNIFLYEENFFYKNWNKFKETPLNSNYDLITYNLALENIEDLEYINNIKEKIDLIDIKKLDSFKDNENYVLVIIYSTEGKFKAYIKTLIKNINVDRSVKLNIIADNKNKSYDEAITVLKKEINQIWKEQNLIDVNTPSYLDFFLEIKKTSDYLKLKSILDAIDVIENYLVLEMTNEYLKVRIKYRGKVSKIKNKLSDGQVSLKIIDNVWKLKIK